MQAKPMVDGTVNTDLNTFSTMMSMSSSRGRTKKMTFFTSAGGTLPLLRVNIFSTSCSLTRTKRNKRLKYLPHKNASATDVFIFMS